MYRLFRSRIGWWYYLLIFLMTFICVRVFMIDKMPLIVVAVIILFFVLHIYFSTYYIVTRDGSLIMKCSIFPRKVVAIANIKRLEYSASPSFAYALSMKRMLIRQKDDSSIIISPEKEELFINLLLQLNPDIEVRIPGEQ